MKLLVTNEILVQKATKTHKLNRHENALVTYLASDLVKQKPMLGVVKMEIFQHLLTLVFFRANVANAGLKKLFVV